MISKPYTQQSPRKWVFFHASNNTSTAPGDSGGPMFCAHNGNLYLLGVTLGSNFRPNQMIADDPIVSNEATFLCRNGELF
ncbi:trypsin-like serine protease [Marinomonas transparens]|uniref:Trypsin-like serine protease n=1 Tax=Marinomonas transparens TaxID=2795388 RepID=A0A934JN69_9GAMM|nr:trypsin-like serine protease [Marinomonas transparens]